MVFSSLIFVFLFLTMNLAVYFLVRSVTVRNLILLAFSLVFYSWGGLQYLFLLLGMAACSWFCARMIGRAIENGKTGKLWLVIDCVVSLGLLGIFKYAVFVLTNLQLWTGFPDSVPEIVLPIGISFYTFQLISYVVDVYRKEVDAQPRYWKVLLYCSLFHQCIAGPIVRYQTVAAEIDNRSVTADDVADGIRRFSVGLAKKAVLANGCAMIADTLLENTVSAPVAGLWLGMFCYMLQIYLDFSAYSDMAIGMGRMVGFHYLENFDYPYMASSVQDFWRRWHISLSTFFRDYVYIPLGGSRRGNLSTVRNMFIVWFLTGFWHGASWNYMLWGLYFFVFLIFERFLWKKVLERIPRVFGHIYALLVIFFGWVIFKFEDLPVLWQALSGMFGAGARPLSSMTVYYTFLNHIFLIGFCVIAVTPLGKKLRDFCYGRVPENGAACRLLQVLDAVLPAALLVLSLLTLVGDSYNPFLYFQF